MAYAQIRPVHVADLLSREGHPLAARMSDEREERAAEAKDPEAGRVVRRSLGMAAGAALVFGAVVAGALGFNNAPDGSPSASGEPVGAAPSPGRNALVPAKTPAETGSTPAAAQTVSPQFTNTAAEKDLPQPGPSTQIGRPAKVAPPAPAQPAPAQPGRPAAPAPAPSTQAPAAPAPSAQSNGPVQTLTEPVTDTVSPTLSDTVAPVTETVDDTLQPALSLIGGLLGR